MCSFVHRKPEGYGDKNKDFWACRPFAISGVCDRGNRCPFLHVYQCPDFQEKGTCPRGNSCSLEHPITAQTQLRMLNGPKKTEEDDILVESDSEDNDKLVIISSFTVDPSLLFNQGSNDKYEIYIDNSGSTPNNDDPEQNTFQQDKEFMINLQDSDESEYSSDDLGDNNDYVQFEVE